MNKSSNALGLPNPVQRVQYMLCGLRKSGKPGSILLQREAMASSFSRDMEEKLTPPNPTAMLQGLGQMGRDGRRRLSTSFSQEEDRAGLLLIRGLPRWLSGEESACRRTCRLEPWGGKIPGAGKGSPLQYSCLGNPMDRGAWRASVHGVTNSQT